MDLLGRHFKELEGLFHHVLAISYITFNGQFYGQTDGVAMGSPLSPVIANIYVEDYEKAALESAPLKPRCWFRYVDDTFIIWQHGPDKLTDFLHHLNSIHQSIQFTMETESEGHLSFLDLDTYRRPDGSLVHKCTASPHTPISTSTPSPIITYPVSKRYCLLCNEGSLQADLVFLKDVLKQNGYDDRQIQRALKPPSAFR
jgi:hypothetical protein